MVTEIWAGGFSPWKHTPEQFEGMDVTDAILELAQKQDEEGLTEEEQVELKALRKFISDNPTSMVFIRDDYFEQHAMEIAQNDLEFITDLSFWPWKFVDWDKAVEELKKDYRKTSLHDVVYWTQDNAKGLERAARA